MDENSLLGQSNIDGWESDYKNLKNARHIRNQLAHSRDSFSDELCTKEQLEFVRSFKKRVQKGKDPLSLLQTKKKLRSRFNIFLVSLLVVLIAALIVKLFILK